MTRLAQLRTSTPADAEQRYSLNQWALDALGGGTFGFDGSTYPFGLNTTWGDSKAEMIAHSYDAYVAGGYKSSAPVFGCINARLSVFTEVRFQWQNLGETTPGRTFGTQGLEILERPWPGAQTGDLLAYMEQHDSLAGNAYITLTESGHLMPLRPDWVAIILGSPSGDPEDLDAVPTGYLYYPGGPSRNNNPVVILPPKMAHYAPTPDPAAKFRGMSWLTPVIREIQSDKAATDHKLKFFENAATPNVAVSLDKAVTPAQFREFVETMDSGHKGVRDAYKTLYLAGGADATVIGADMKQLDFKNTQGAGETRICSAAGVPPIIANLSEGLQAATYSNYGQARRAFGDMYARPHWRKAAGALEGLLDVPPGARLWYDASDVSFLQEDEKDAADILAADAQTVRTLVDAGFEPASVVQAVKAGDLTQLTHTNLYSVQLQAPGTTGQPTPAA